MTWERQGCPHPHREQGGCSGDRAKPGLYSSGQVWVQISTWVQGKFLGCGPLPPGERGPGSEGLQREKEGGRSGRPSKESSSFCLWSGNIWRHTDHREAGGGPSRCLGQSAPPPRTCQGCGPGVRWGPMPGRALNELPAYLHVLINHKMSPRGRIKLSVSLCLLPLPPPPLPAAPHPYTFLYRSGPRHSHSPVPSASVKYSFHPITTKAQKRREKKKLAVGGCK